MPGVDLGQPGVQVVVAQDEGQFGLVLVAGAGHPHARGQALGPHRRGIPLPRCTSATRVSRNAAEALGPCRPAISQYASVEASVAGS